MKTSQIWRWLGSMLLLAIQLDGTQASKSLYVDCNHGSDSGDGTLAHPYQTLMKARDQIRSLQPLGEALTVQVLASDCFPRDASGAINFSKPVLELEASDSGSLAAPITYSARAGDGVRLLSGMPIPAAAWKPTAGRAGVFQVALGADGIDVAKYGFGSLAAGGLGTCDETAMELFWGPQGSAQTLARYPNIVNGTWQWLNIWRVLDPASSFAVNGSNAERIATWRSAPRGWLHGYWSFDWADSYVEIAAIGSIPGGTSINVSAKTAPLYGFLPDARFYGTNIFSELDAEGEYFIDVDTATLYFMPPGGDPRAWPAFLSLADFGITTASQTAVAGGVSVPRFLSPRALMLGPVRASARPGAAGVLSYVNFVGFGVLFARNTGIALANVANVSITDVDSSSHGHRGISLFGSGNAIRRVRVVGTGCAASSVYGGDTQTLEPGRNTVSDSVFSQFARTIRTYNPGVGWGGVGNSYWNNTISQAPHCGMLGGGVSNLFLNNTFDTLCFEATDSGAWYAGRSWTSRGNVLQGNTFNNIRNREHMTLGSPFVQAIYLDDQLSGTQILDNTCTDSQNCFFIGGGRDTIVRGNLCAGAVDTCVHIDDRGLGWQATSCWVNATFTGALVQGLLAVHYTQPPYSTAFPEIVHTLERRPCTPFNITVAGNRYCKTVKQFIDVTANQTRSWGDSVANNSAITC